jgi:hypothetical protein
MFFSPRAASIDHVVEGNRIGRSETTRHADRPRRDAEGCAAARRFT